MKFLIFIFIGSVSYAQNIVTGCVLSEDSFVLQNVMIININTGNKVFANSEGGFKIEANVNDELRFLKENFERESKIIQSKDFSIPLSIKLVRISIEIEEVKVAVKLTGNLDRDANSIKIDNSKEILQKEIGLPQPKGIQREKVVTVKKDILLPLLSLSPTVNIDAIYKLISGEARKMKYLYKYEDMQRNINWITERNGAEYFIERGIPKERIGEFLEFSILIEPELIDKIKSNNLSAVNFILVGTETVYLKRLKG